MNFGSSREGYGTPGGKVPLNLILRNGGLWTLKGLHDLGPKPGVMGCRIDREAGWKRAFLGYTGQKDSHGIRNRHAHAIKHFSSLIPHCRVDPCLDQGSSSHDIVSHSGRNQSVMRLNDICKRQP